MSSFYQKYFEGYEEDKVPKENGKGLKIKHNYVGIYYYQDIPVRIQLLTRISYIALFLGALTLFIHASMQRLGCNTTPYVIVCQSLTILTFIWFAWVVIHYVIAERKMKIYTYKSTSLKLIMASMVAAGVVGLNALSVLVYVLSNWQDEPKKQLICLVEYVLGSGCLFLINRIEKKIPYKRIRNNNKECR